LSATTIIDVSVAAIVRCCFLFLLVVGSFFVFRVSAAVLKHFPSVNFRGRYLIGSGKAPEMHLA